MKKRARYCATFASNVRHRRETVRPPEGEGSVAKLKEVLQEDVKGHELLRIDMDWSIHNRGPETLMHSSLEVNAASDASVDTSISQSSPDRG